MDVDKLFLLANNFFYTHTYFSIGIIAAFVIVLFLWPKPTIKYLLILSALLVAAYILYQIGEAVVTGVGNKKKILGK